MEIFGTMKGAYFLAGIVVTLAVEAALCLIAYGVFCWGISGFGK